MGPRASAAPDLRLILRKYLLLFPVFSAIIVLNSVLVSAQELPGRQSFGVNATFAPTSSHILLGEAGERRTWTGGFEYGRTLYGNRSTRIDYEASISPFFVERDPTLTAAYYLDQGVIVEDTSFPLGRVTHTSTGPIGYIAIGSGPVTPVYGSFSTEKTYAFAASPIGIRVNGRNSHRLQPTFSVDLGLVLSGRDLPVDNSANLNYLVSLGPGIEFYYRRNRAVRLEYLYRHMSNANSGEYNPGVDQGVFRLTFTYRR